MKLKNIVLSKSNQFNFYKNNYNGLKKTNCSYKKKIRSLENDNANLKEKNNGLAEELKLLRQIIVNNETDVDFNYCPV